MYAHAKHSLHTVNLQSKLTKLTYVGPS